MQIKPHFNRILTPVGKSNYLSFGLFRCKGHQFKRVNLDKRIAEHRHCTTFSTMFSPSSVDSEYFFLNFEDKLSLFFLFAIQTLQLWFMIITVLNANFTIAWTMNDSLARAESLNNNFTAEHSNSNRFFIEFSQRSPSLWVNSGSRVRPRGCLLTRMTFFIPEIVQVNSMVTTAEMKRPGIGLGGHQ